MVDGGPCSFDEGSGMPEADCWFIPEEGKNDDVESSLMALPLFEPVNY